MVISRRLRLDVPANDLDATDEVSRRVARRRGSVPMPFEALLRWPELCRPVSDLGEFFRYGGTLPGRLRETAVLSVARSSGCDFELAHHAPIARREGVAPGTLDGSWLDSPEDEAAVGSYVAELAEGWRVSDATHARVRRFLDEGQTVELSLLAGYYLMVAAFINANELVDDSSCAPSTPCNADGPREIVR